MRTVAPAPKGSHWREIARWIAAIHRVDPAEMTRPGRRRDLAHARQHLMAVLNLREGRSPAVIGRLLRCDRTTVIHGVGAHLARAGVDHPRARAVRRRAESWRAAREARS